GDTVRRLFRYTRPDLLRIGASRRPGDGNRRRHPGPDRSSTATMSGQPPLVREEFAMLVAKLTPAEVREAAEKLPRVRLAHLPTPLEEASRFAQKLGRGVRVFIKRDDCTGLLLGGNKARHNEFLLGDALAQGCDTFVWGAGVQSNNCR